MKKIILTLAAVTVAVGAHAAVANWSASCSNIYDGTGATAAKWSGVAYIFAVSESVTQDSIWNTFSTGGDISNSAAATLTAVAGTISGANGVFSYGEQGGGSYSYFMVLVDGDNILITKTLTATANGTATNKALGFGSLLNTSKELPTQGSYAIGSWAAAPEPTSGLLLLLGMAGLALKRKRA